MSTTFGTISPEELAARREVMTDIERFRREYENSVAVPPNILGHEADAARYGNISPRTAREASSALLDAYQSPLESASRSIRFHRFGEERDMPEPTKNYLGLCCGLRCAGEKMRFIKSRHPEAVIDVERHYITVGNYRFIFLVNPENNHQRLMGLELTAYRVCSHYSLSPELRDILATRIRQPSTLRFRRYNTLPPLSSIVP